MLLPTLTLTLLGVLALGFGVFAAAPGRSENRAFAAFTWLGALWVANDLSFWCFHGPETSGRAWGHAAFLIAAALQVSFLRFAWVFPSPWPLPLRISLPALLPALLLLPLAAGGQLLGRVGFEGGSFRLETTPWTFFAGAYVIGLFAAGWVVVVRRHAAARDPALRRQLRLLLVAPAVAGPVTLTSAVALPLLGVYELLPYSSLAILVGAALHAWSVFELGFLRPRGVLDALRLFPVSAKLALAVCGAGALGVAGVLGAVRLALGPGSPGAWQQAVVLAVAVASLPAMGLVLVGQELLTRPLRRLTEVAVRVAGGDLSARAALPPRGDEVSVLADAVDDMVARLARELEAQRELQEALVGVERLTTVGALAAGVAHEVNNPLAAVSSLVQLARERAGDARVRELLGDALAQVERTSRALQDLLEVARPPARVRRPCDLAEVARATTRLLGYDRRFRRVGLDAEVAEGLPRIAGDPDQLRQVLINLLLNAADAVEGGPEPRVLVRVAAVEAEGRPAVEVRVLDSGPGFPAEVQERAFDPFFTTKPPGRGTGLGLAVCREVVRAHDGRIELGAGELGGAEVRVVLPAEPEEGARG